MKKLFKLSDVLVNYKNLITTLVTNFGVLGVNVLTGILIARFLGPEGRGEQSAILLWPQFLAYLMTLGLPAATLYYVRFDPKSSSLYTKVSLTLGLFLGLLSTLIGIIIMPLLLKSYSDEIVYFARCFMLLSPISLLSVILNSLMQSKEQYEVYNWFRFLPSIVTLLGLLILVALKNFNPVTTSLILAFAQIPVFIYGIFWVLRNFELDIKINMSKGKDLLNYALRAYPVDLLRTLGDQLDRVVVVGLLTPTLMGYYVVALSLSRVLNAVQTAMITVLIPDLIQQEERVIRRKTLRALLMSTSITGLVAVPLFF
ncbi:lipopolysaccharide biosynthesis protein [Deinococcus gobiensis]|nr:oligosaccharide flippase family protein [Deinococcus gobiensis]